MVISIKFDANQQYQRDAIDAVVELFAGQESGQQGFTSVDLSSDGMLEGFQDVVFGNSLELALETLDANLRRVQGRPVSRDGGGASPAIPEDERRALESLDDLDFSLEMETGTGKTYVYLRTIAELHRKYGWAKFVIVVPSVAIREGVLSSLRLLKEHIRDLYDGLQFDANVWDSRVPTRVHQFATASHLQILVVNIDSFTKETNIMKKREPDRLNGYAPIEYLSACRPIVVMDEPQNMETDIRKAAIASLAPLFRLRYSATHKDLKHLVYRLTPVDAYDLRLVKRIGVLSVEEDDDINEASVDILKVTATPGSVTATARIHKATKQGTRPTQVTLRKDTDLYELSGGRTVYRGWSVEDIHAGQDGRLGYVEFGNGQIAHVGGTFTDSDQGQRFMIRQAVEQHFLKEFQLLRQAKRQVIPAEIKPLTLFFIDKVANYHPQESKFRVWFEQAYEDFRTDPRFRALSMPKVSEVHDGYFATTAKGEPKDIAAGRDTKDAESAYERIMQNKEQLLSSDSPLRFIFSHSALVEGWDNPNVFTICNLQEGKSVMRKRQQIGRGLRLPVMGNGERCHVDEINMVTVIANESFASFASALQQEIEEETGVSFAGRLSNIKKDKIKLELKREALEDEDFKELWHLISQRTTYRVDFATDAVVDEAVRRIDDMPALEPIQFRVSKATVEFKSSGVSANESHSKEAVEVEGARRMPDVVGELTRRVALSRATIIRILRSIENLDQVRVNPAVFIDHVAAAMNEALYAQVAEGIVYSPLGDERWSADLFVDAQQEETVAKPDRVVAVTKSIVDQVVCDSDVEVTFAKFLEAQSDVKLFLKLPGWFLIPTPLGNYNPDWALVRETPEGDRLYLVRETKGTDSIEKLQWESEGWKIKFGEAHFRAIDVDFMFHKDPNVLIEMSPDVA